MTIGNIVTERLILVSLTIDMICDLLNGKNNEIEKLGLKTLNRWPDKDTFSFFPHVLERMQQTTYNVGFEPWIIATKDNNIIVGDAGFKGNPDKKGAVEIGYGIIEQERRKGYALEAVEGLIKWAFSHKNVLTVYADCLIDNDISAKILEKCKFKQTHRDNSLIYWRLDKYDSHGLVARFFNALFHQSSARFVY